MTSMRSLIVVRTYRIVKIEMVAGPIVRAGQYARPIVTKLLQYESWAWNKAYTGIPSHVRKGTRHGFVGGSIIGSLIGQGNQAINDAPFQQQAPYQQRQKRSKFKRNSSGRYGKRYRSGYRSKNSRYKYKSHSGSCRCCC